MSNLLWIVLIANILSGCTAQNESRYKVSEESPQQSIAIGMTVKQVAEKLGLPAGHVGRRQYANGTIDVYHYETYKINYLDDSAAKKEYFFYFWKGRLVRWDRPGEWQPEADRLHEAFGK